MWLIIPKLSSEDRKAWGLYDETLLGFVALADPKNPDASLKCEGRQNNDDGWKSVADGLENIHVLVLDPVIRGQTGAPNIPPEIGESVEGVFVHFGNWNLKEMSLSKIDEKWKELIKSLKLPAMPNAIVMPMSEAGGTTWKEKLNDFRNVFTKERNFTLNNLNDAWEIAFTFFHIDQLMQAMIEALFPLFVDLSNHEISALSELEFNTACSATKKDLETKLSGIMATSKTPACARFKGRLKSIKDSQSSETTRNCAKTGFELLELLEKENLTSADHSAFKMKFEGLSKAYSLHLGLGPVAPATA
jgi:hypothetical protein